MSTELYRQVKINGLISKIKNSHAGLDMASYCATVSLGRSLAEWERTPRFLATVLVDNDWTWAQVLRTNS